MTNFKNREALAVMVKDIILKTGLSYRKFASKANISTSTLINILNPNIEIKPSTTVLQKLALMSDTPHGTYAQLLDLCGYDKNKNTLKTTINNPKFNQRPHIIVIGEALNVTNNEICVVFKDSTDINKMKVMPKIVFENVFSDLRSSLNNDNLC